MMRFLFSVFITLLLLGCNKKEMPTPAISFQNTLKELPDKETNKWLEFSDNMDKDPQTLGYMYSMSTAKYVTKDNDTLTYHFAGEGLLCIITSLYNTDYETAYNNLKTNSSLKEKGNGFFEDNSNVIIRVAKSNAPNTTTLLYLNNKDGEIDFLTKSMQQSMPAVFNQDNDCLYVQYLFGLLGMYAGKNTYYDQTLKNAHQSF